VEFDIAPEPDPVERAAILAALQAEESDRPADSAWARALLPRREESEEPGP
jgi:hypothetical protein